MYIVYNCYMKNWMYTNYKINSKKGSKLFMYLQLEIMLSESYQSRGSSPLSTHSTPQIPIKAPQININGSRCRPKAAARRQKSVPTCMTTPTDNEIKPIEHPSVTRNRPKHGEHKWMRQLSTMEKQEDLLEDLLTNPQTRLIPKPPTPFPSTPFPFQSIEDESRTRHYNLSGHYDTQPDYSSIQLSQESYFSPFSPTTYGKSQSLPRLLQEAEKRLPRTSSLLVDQRHKVSSIPKLPKITSTCLVSPMEGRVMHRKSRSFSDPTIHPLYADNNN